MSKMSHREQRHTFLEEKTIMRKIQEFLRAHCYDIAAYFISTTGLLFPRQAIAGDWQRLHLAVSPAKAPAIILISGQILFAGSKYWNEPDNLHGVCAHSRFPFQNLAADPLSPSRCHFQNSVNAFKRPTHFRVTSHIGLDYFVGAPFDFQ
jgi:hypothetical protein